MSQLFLKKLSNDKISDKKANITSTAVTNAYVIHRLSEEKKDYDVWCKRPFAHTMFEAL